MRGASFASEQSIRGEQALRTSAGASGIASEGLKRVLIIGTGGSGKTTAARRLAERTGLPLIHLDQLYWRAGWQPTPAEEWQAKVEHALRGDQWIIDGNYGGTLDLRLQACDTVVFLDLPRIVCLWRVFKRWLRYNGRQRPDVSPGCTERLSWEFLTWIWTYRKRRRGHILERLATLETRKRVIVLRSPGAVNDFLARL